MPLVQCSECGASVSSAAAACPKCGAPPPAVHAATGGTLTTTQQTSKRLKLHIVGGLLLTSVCATALVRQVQAQPSEKVGFPVVWIAGAVAGIGWLVSVRRSACVRTRPRLSAEGIGPRRPRRLSARREWPTSRVA
jgi:hypothetical protein